MAISAEDRRTRIAQFRLTESEHLEAHEEAKTAGLSFSSYCRARVVGHRVVASADRATIRELRRIGGLLKRVHTESKGAYKADTARALTEIVACITRIATR